MRSRSRAPIATFYLWLRPIGLALAAARGMKIKSLNRGTARTRHRIEAVDIDAVASEGRHTVSCIRPGSYSAAHRSGIKSGQAGIVLR